MKYNIFVYETAEDFAARTDTQKQGDYWASYSAYTKALEEAGVMAGGAALQPPATGTTVRLVGGERHVQDGPLTETKEQLGGYYTIDVPDLDAALKWAAKCPSASTGGVEVRPLLEM
ncbi:MAG: YciI family protein [Planctomycetota bacterium]